MGAVLSYFKIFLILLLAFYKTRSPKAKKIPKHAIFLCYEIANLHKCIQRARQKLLLFKNVTAIIWNFPDCLKSYLKFCMWCIFEQVSAYMWECCDEMAEECAYVSRLTFSGLRVKFYTISFVFIHHIVFT